MNLPLAACSLAALLLTACAGTTGARPGATASLKPTQGNTASGSVQFHQTASEVVVIAQAEGLAPGAHGFHIHDKGDCSAADGTSAGGHFNPTGKAHGDPAKAEHHAGDMPMLIADANGKAHLETRLAGVSIGSGRADIVGRAVIIHAAPDDFQTQPTGNSGARVACGVIVTR